MIIYFTNIDSQQLAHTIKRHVYDVLEEFKIDAEEVVIKYIQDQPPANNYYKMDNYYKMGIDVTEEEAVRLRLKFGDSLKTLLKNATYKKYLDVLTSRDMSEASYGFIKGWQLRIHRILYKRNAEAWKLTPGRG